MYKYGRVITALEGFCAEHGESLEEREKRLAAKSAPIRQALHDEATRVIQRKDDLIQVIWSILMGGETQD
jgi:hypothetical protein